MEVQSVVEALNEAIELEQDHKHLILGQFINTLVTEGQIIMVLNSKEGFVVEVKKI